MRVRIFRGRPHEPAWRAHVPQDGADQYWRRCVRQADCFRLGDVLWVVTPSNGYAEGELLEQPQAELEEPSQVFYRPGQHFECQGSLLPLAWSANVEFRADGSSWCG